MKTPGLLIAILLAALAAPVATMAQTSSSAAASASIVSPGGIGEVNGPSFGSAHSPKGPDESATTTSASYALSGPVGQTASVQISENVSMRRAGGQDRLTATFDVLRLSPTDAGGAATRNLQVAGAIKVTSHANPGLYAGTLTLMVGYN